MHHKPNKQTQAIFRKHCLSRITGGKISCRREDGCVCVMDDAETMTYGHTRAVYLWPEQFRRTQNTKQTNKIRTLQKQVATQVKYKLSTNQ